MTAHTSPKAQNNAELTQHEIAALLQIASRLEEMHQSLIRMKNLVPLLAREAVLPPARPKTVVT
jgi:hypothetical protein